MVELTFSTVKRMFGRESIRSTALAEIVRTRVLPEAARLCTHCKSGGTRVCRICRTKAVKDVLRLVGQERRFAVYPDTDNEDAPRREWLYDLVWWKDDKRVVLAVESEWSGRVDNVLYDFRKLLAVKSTLKLFWHSSGFEDIQQQRIGSSAAAK